MYGNGIEDFLFVVAFFPIFFLIIQFLPNRINLLFVTYIFTPTNAKNFLPIVTLNSEIFLGQFCGTKAPKQIRIKSGNAYILFHSDSFLEYRGFSGKFEFVRSRSTCNETNSRIRGMNMI